MTTNPNATISKLSDSGRSITPGDDIRGRTVRDKDGVDLGKVHDLLIDAQEHRVRFLLVEHGGFLGLGARDVFIPVDDITTITEIVVSINHTREHVAAAPATLGQVLREFTHGHTLQLASVLRAHLVRLVGRSDLLPGIEQRAFVDVDSLLRPVFGHAKQGASYGHTKIAGKQVLRKGLSPLVTTIGPTERGAPVAAGVRLRAGRAGSGKGAASMVTEAIRTARAAGADGEIVVRGDSAYGNSAVVGACVKAGVRFSVVLAKNTAVSRAITAIAEDAWTPPRRRYPGQRPARGCQRRDSAAPHRHRPGTSDPAATPPDTAPARALAVG